jgi:predicted SAM-dependent methyltransferase
MAKQVASLIRKGFNALGLDIRRHQPVDPNLALYHSLYPQESVLKRRFYNVGAGLFRHPAWTNVDHYSDWYKGNVTDIDYDLEALTPIPVESGSAEVVYTSHTVEHITNAAAQNLFNEAYRMLKPGGYFRMTTPNIDLEYRAYRENDRHYFFWIDRYSKQPEMERAKVGTPLNQASIQQIFLLHFASNVSTLHSDGAAQRIGDEELDRVFREMPFEAALDYCTGKVDLAIHKKYPGNHINWWNKDKAFRMLQQAGFGKIYLSGHGQSFCPVMRDTHYFDSTHPKISLYVEAAR